MVMEGKVEGEKVDREGILVRFSFPRPLYYWR
jgi:hypothetical protein